MQILGNLVLLSTKLFLEIITYCEEVVGIGYGPIWEKIEFEGSCRILGIKETWRQRWN
jgi:hypothetical protein